mgnify:CR=1 FL=1
MRFLFVLIILFILILFGQKYLAHFQISRLKKKIKSNPDMGTKQQDNSYAYKEEGYTISYRVIESPLGVKAVEWLSLKRRLTVIEKNILDIKRSLNKFFLYQRWVTLFRPSVIIVLTVSLIIFYLGIKEESFKRIGHFKWIVAQITGISPESIGYTDAGWFNISGQKMSVEGEVEPVKISFNPLRWLFFSDTANVSFWSNKLNRYVSYPLTINDKGDVWLDKKSEQVHGKVLSDKIVWDPPQRAGIRAKVSGHRIAVEDGQLKIFDE